MRGVQNLEGGVAENGDFRQGGQDALYPALSGEWEVPVTRNAKITPVNEGAGAFGRVPVTRNAEIDPPA